MHGYTLVSKNQFPIIVENISRIHNYVKQSLLSHREFVPGLYQKPSYFTFDEVGGDDFQTGHSSIQHYI